VSEPRDRLDELAARVAGNPFFLAWALAVYQRPHRLTDLDLAAALHCDPSVLLDLRLCRRPVPEGERYVEDIGAIAGRFGCDRAVLQFILEETGRPPRRGRGPGAPMKLSHAAGYAVHALVYIARQPPGRFVPCRAVARAHGFPETYLRKVLEHLAFAGLLRSAPGPDGGYRLTRPARDITVLQVVEAIDGPVRSAVPVGFAPAKDRLDKRLAGVCQQATELVRQRLGKVRLADLVKG
jgi:Rrf2 family protein